MNAVAHDSQIAMRLRSPSRVNRSSRLRDGAFQFRAQNQAHVVMLAGDARPIYRQHPGSARTVRGTFSSRWIWRYF